MSVFCPKCGKKTYDEYTCDHCRYTIKEKDYQQQEKKLIIKEVREISIEKILLIIAAFIAAIGIAYIAYTKYEEKRLNDKALEMFIGTSDPDKIEEKLHAQMKNLNKSFDKSMKEINKNTGKLINISNKK